MKKLLILVFALAVVALVVYVKWDSISGIFHHETVPSEPAIDPNPVSGNAKVIYELCYVSTMRYSMNHFVKAWTSKQVADVAKMPTDGNYDAEVTSAKTLIALSSAKSVNLSIVDDDSIWNNELMPPSKKPKTDDVLIVVEVKLANESRYFFGTNHSHFFSATKEAYDKKFPNDTGLIQIFNQ